MQLYLYDPSTNFTEDEEKDHLLIEEMECTCDYSLLNGPNDITICRCIVESIIEKLGDQTVTLDDPCISEKIRVLRGK